MAGGADDRDPFGSGLRGLLEPHGGHADDPEPHPDGWLASVAVVLRPPTGAGGAATPDGDPLSRIRRTELLLIRRAANDRDPWSGHMALPGGRKEPGDASLVETARRETREEVGVGLGEAPFLGALSVVAPRNAQLPPLTVVPMVFRVPPGTEATIRAREEVAELHWVELGHLMDPANRTRVRYPPAGDLAFPAIEVGGRDVWGLTHRVLSDFLDRVRQLG